jgi:hypothetical protein
MNSKSADNEDPNSSNMANQKRRIAIPITRANFSTVALMAGISTSELHDELMKAQAEHKRTKDREWAISLLEKDEKWFDETLAAIELIRKTLPEGMDREEKTICLYGWIADTVKPGILTQPLMENTEFRRADTVNLILENPALYMKIRNWD